MTARRDACVQLGIGPRVLRLAEDLLGEEAGGDVFVTWRQPAAFAADHGLAADHGPLPNFAALLEALARTAAGSE